MTTIDTVREFQPEWPSVTPRVIAATAGWDGDTTTALEGGHGPNMTKRRGTSATAASSSSDGGEKAPRPFDKVKTSATLGERD